jgi:hypothetical protein
LDPRPPFRLQFILVIISDMNISFASRGNPSTGWKRSVTVCVRFRQQTKHEYSIVEFLLIDTVEAHLLCCSLLSIRSIYFVIFVRKKQITRG